MALFEIGASYPHDEHIDRIRRYKENKKLFKGEHYDVFKKIQDRLSNPADKDLIYISVNLPGIIAKKSADFLFGETPTYNAGKEENSPEQQAIERLIRENRLDIKNYQSALGNAYRGDSFFKLRWGQKYGGKVPKKYDPFRVIIENQNPEFVFPETAPGDATEIIAYHIAFPVVNIEGEDYILEVESHYPGLIEYTRWGMRPDIVNADGEIEQWKIYAEKEESGRQVETGVPFPLVVHIPNYQTDDDWEGIDDLSEHKPIIDEINNRLTQISNILDKHADPPIAVPSGSLGEDEDGEPTFAVGRDKVFEVMGKDDVVPQYITWNGQLQAAFEELKQLLEYLLMCAEIPAVALGKGESGTSGSSGLSIKFRMNSLLAKINRKRQFYDKGLKEILYLAQLLEHTKKSKKPDYEITEPKIEFKDGLPEDKAQEAEIMKIRTGEKPTISQKSALMRIDGLTEEQAERELERINGDEDAQAKREVTASPSIFNEEPNVDEE